MEDQRHNILNRVRRALKVSDEEDARRARVQDRLTSAPAGVLPQIAQGDKDTLVARFIENAKAVQTSIDRVARADIVAAIARYLRTQNLPMTCRMGDDPLLAALPWEDEPMLTVRHGASDGSDPVGISHAHAAIAEAGTLVLPSGANNPTTVNLLPDTHIVILEESAICGSIEAAFARLRAAGAALPRCVNLISGPSRSADIEQTLLLGAHGPRQLHTIIVTDN